jgi:hypothetical protein
MERRIFYSWQSDLPNSANRGFIEEALDRAARAIRMDDTVEVEPVVDRDTAGVAGSPDIATTIFSKIADADMFIADVSIVSPGMQKRRTPNPNVLIELGYALRALGDYRVITVMNTAFGGPEELPFDLKMRRVITYNVPEGAQGKAGERQTLAAKLEQAIRSVLADLRTAEAPSQPSIAEALIAAVTAADPRQSSLGRRYMADLCEKLDGLAPDYGQAGERDDLLVAALAGTVPAMTEFGEVCEAVSASGADLAARGIYRGFQNVLERYSTPKGFSGSYSESDFDFFRFVGHELFVVLFATLIREERWDLIDELLAQEIYVETDRRSGPLGFERVSTYVRLLDDYRKKRLQLRRVSVRADILNERHTEGPLAQVVPMRLFTDADLLLFLRSVLTQERVDHWHAWRPWSAIYAEWKLPQYLAEAVSRRSAERLTRPLGVTSVEELKDRLPRAAQLLQQMFSHSTFFEGPFAGFDPAAIASRP